jgi:hypothetical protein
MKPYGKKPQKSKLTIHCADECDTCNNKGWKISKKRERKTKIPLDFPEKDPIVTP